MEGGSSLSLPFADVAKQNKIVVVELSVVLKRKSRRNCHVRSISSISSIRNVEVPSGDMFSNNTQTVTRGKHLNEACI